MISDPTCGANGTAVRSDPQPMLSVPFSPRRFAVVLLAVVTSVSPDAKAVDFRLQVNGGYAATTVESDAFERFEDRSRPAFVTDLGTGSGPAFGAAAWVDGLLHPNLSLGVEYLHTEVDPDARIRFAPSLPVAPMPLPADITTDIVFANLALRRSAGPLRPYLGFGLGVGYLEVSVDTERFSGSFDEVIGGGQGFVGLDYDLGSGLYAGASLRAFYLPQDASGFDAEILQIIGMAGVGLRF